MRLLPLALVLVLASAGAAPAAPAQPIDVTPAIAAQIDTALRTATGTVRGTSPALSAAVVEDGRIVYAQAFGLRDLATHEAATPQTRFAIASVTKMFTAVAIMQLVEAGRIGLDAPLAAYLPAAPHAKAVTIRELLMHTSGLWNYADAAFADGRAARPTTLQAILASVAAHPLQNKPGTTFSYSNSGYLLLGLVVESVSHQKLGEYEREHIFAPADMHRTSASQDAQNGASALGYANATGKRAAAYSPTWVFADGDLLSTASDLARFDIALMAGKLVKPATFEQMQSGAIAAPDLGLGVSYGLGLTLTPAAGITFVGHHGGVPGFAAENELIPERGYAVIVLSDASDFPTSIANYAIVRRTLPEFATAANAEPSPTATDDAAVDAKAKTFLTGIQHASVDRTTLTDTMNAALTPEVLRQLSAQFAPLGTLQSLDIRSTDSIRGYSVYHYRATFSSGQTIPLTFSLDKDGKVAGLQGV